MPTTFASLEKACDALRTKDDELWNAVDDVLDRARGNANDTIYVDKAESEDNFDAIAIGSVEGILSCGAEMIETVEWFTAQGIRF